MIYFSRVVNEIDEVLGDREDVDASDLEDLTYTQQVCKFIIVMVHLYTCLHKYTDAYI